MTVLGISSMFQVWNVTFLTRLCAFWQKSTGRSTRSSENVFMTLKRFAQYSLILWMWWNLNITVHPHPGQWYIECSTSQGTKKHWKASAWTNVSLHRQDTWTTTEQQMFRSFLKRIRFKANPSISLPLQIFTRKDWKESRALWWWIRRVRWCIRHALPRWIRLGKGTQRNFVCALIFLTHMAR